MSYSLFSKSRQDSNAVLLFHFVQGATNWRYTSCARNITYDSETWTATPIKCGKITVNSEIDKNKVNLEFPRDHAFARQFISATPDVVTLVTIYRGNLSDPDEEYEAYWKGRVVGGANTTGSKIISVDCEQIFTSQRRSGAYGRCQKMCRAALYSTACGLDADDYDVSATCTSALSTELTVTEAGLSADDTYTGGMVEYGGVRKYIMVHSGTSLSLMSPFYDLNTEVQSNGDTAVLIYPGCAHNITACIAYGNVINMKAFPFIPQVDPFKGTPII